MKTINEENPEKFNDFFEIYFKNGRQTTSTDRIIQDRYNTAVNELKRDHGGPFFEGDTPREFAVATGNAIRNNPKLSREQKEFVINLINGYCAYAAKQGLNISSNEDDEKKRNQKIVDAENAKGVKNYNSNNKIQSAVLRQSREERQNLRKERQAKEDKEKLASGYSAKQGGKFLGEEIYFNY
jgi:hypothetical protein